MSDTNIGTIDFPETPDPIPELTDAEKLDFVYKLALKASELIESITDEQVQQVKKVYNNPLLRKMLGG